MASPLIGELVTRISSATTVMGSAKELIKGFKARLQAGIDAALASGATEAELAPLTTLSADLGTAEGELAQAVVENTDAA